MSGCQTRRSRPCSKQRHQNDIDAEGKKALTKNNNPGKIPEIRDNRPRQETVRLTDSQRNRHTQQTDTHTYMYVETNDNGFLPMVCGVCVCVCVCGCVCAHLRFCACGLCVLLKAMFFSSRHVAVVFFIVQVFAFGSKLPLQHHLSLLTTETTAVAVVQAYRTQGNLCSSCPSLQNTR